MALCNLLHNHTHAHFTLTIHSAGHAHWYHDYIHLLSCDSYVRPGVPAGPWVTIASSTTNRYRDLYYSPGISRAVPSTEITICTARQEFFEQYYQPKSQFVLLARYSSSSTTNRYRNLYCSPGIPRAVLPTDIAICTARQAFPEYSSSSTINRNCNLYCSPGIPRAVLPTDIAICTARQAFPEYSSSSTINRYRNLYCSPGIPRAVLSTGIAFCTARWPQLITDSRTFKPDRTTLRLVYPKNERFSLTPNYFCDIFGIRKRVHSTGNRQRRHGSQRRRLAQMDAGAGKKL